MDYPQKQLIYQKETKEKQIEFKKQVLEQTSRENSIENEFSFSQNTLWSVIENFSYSSEEDVTFASYFRRYEDLYKTDCENWSDSKKIRLLLSKLCTTEHTKFINYILPRKTWELTFTEVVELLMEFFSPKISLFHKRWKCLKLTSKEGEDLTTFASLLNKHCEDFRLAELTAVNFTIYGLKKGLPTHTANRLQRWSTILLNYDFKMVYLPSNKFGHANGLLRFPNTKNYWKALIKITLCNSVRELPMTN